MKQEIKVYATDDIKFDQIYGDSNYSVILKFVPYHTLNYDEMHKLKEVLKHRTLKLTIEEFNDEKFR